MKRWRAWISYVLLYLRCFPRPAITPSRGDGANVDRCVNEQHDGEDIRFLLHCPYAGCARAGQYSCGITWKGTELMCIFVRAHCTVTTAAVAIHSFFPPVSSTRWISMRRSSWQLWVLAWRRGTIQVRSSGRKSKVTVISSWNVVHWSYCSDSLNMSCVS